MSTLEFFAGEDDRAGQPRGTALADFNTSWDEDARRWEAQHWQPAFILDLLLGDAYNEMENWTLSYGELPWALAALINGQPIPEWCNQFYHYVAVDERRPHIPVKVILVLAARAVMRFGGSTVEGRALVRAEDDHEYIVTYNVSDSSGGWDEPPNHEAEIVWEPYVALSEAGCPEPERDEAEVQRAFKRSSVTTWPLTKDCPF